MSEDAMTPREREVQALVRELPEVRADAAFAAKLRADFVSGTLADAVEPPEEPGVLSFPGGRFAIGLAAAAVLAGLVMIFNHGPSWTLTGTSGSGTVVVAGTEVDAGDTAALEKLLHAGATVRLSGDAQLDLALPGRLEVQVTPGSDVTLPNAPGRWFGRDLAADIRRGELRVVTGPGFAGSLLTVTSPAAMIEVLGTTLAIIAAPGTTCVCVLEGEVAMTDADGRVMVPGGMRRTVFMDGSDPVEGEILDMERMKLGMMRDAALPRLEESP